MYIDCLWVSGSFKGHGYSNDLLSACIEDSKQKGKKGLCILCAAKKKPFLADPKFLKHKGFTVCDESDNGIQLWYLPFFSDAQKPRFKDCAKHPHIDDTGYVLYYTSNARSMQNTFRSWSRRPNSIAFLSGRFILNRKRRRRRLQHQSQHIIYLCL